MSKLGAHVTAHPRNGFGDFCEAGPAMVISVNDGGALDEAKRKSGGKTVTIFRDTTCYLEFPGMAEWTVEHATGAAGYWWPKLREKWSQNPADYYTVMNEQGGNDPHSYQVTMAFERGVMQLANAEGYKCCVLNLGGDPDNHELWKALLLPHIYNAHKRGNIYGRHCYDTTFKALVELPHLKEFGGLMAITELGWNGGYGFLGIDELVKRVKAVDAGLMHYDNLIGFALWELGDTEFHANWQDALPELTAYLHSCPEVDVPYVPPTPEPLPEPGDGYARVVHNIGHLNFRIGPGTNYEDIGDLEPAGGPLEIIGQDGPWYKLAAWAHGDYLVHAQTGDPLENDPNER